MIVIEVNGRPAPQGNHRVNKGGAIYETSTGIGPWREAVRAETQRVMGGCMPLDGPLECRINFRLPRPSSAPRKVLFPVKRRDDLDKLTRAVLDGLTDGGAWGDDGQVVTLMCTKRFATEAAPAGCSIQITAEVAP